MAPAYLNMDLWTALGGIDSYIDFTSMINFGHTIISGRVLSAFLTGEFGGEHVIYTVDLIALIMCMATAAYIVVMSVAKSVTTSKYYFIYANYSAIGNLLYLWDMFLLVMWQLWAMVLTIMAFVSAHLIW